MSDWPVSLVHSFTFCTPSLSCCQWTLSQGRGLPPMVLLVNVVADHPAESASDEHVRWKVLLAENARQAHAGCQAVDTQLMPAARVLVGKDRRGGPGDHAVG